MREGAGDELAYGGCRRGDVRTIFTNTESTFGTGRNTVRGIALTTFTSPASCASTELTPYAPPPGAAASRSPTSRCTITNHKATLSSSSIVRSNDARGNAIRQIRHHLGRRGRHRGEVDAHRVAPPQRDVVKSTTLALQRAAQTLVELHHVHVCSRAARDTRKGPPRHRRSPGPRPAYRTARRLSPDHRRDVRVAAGSSVRSSLCCALDHAEDVRVCPGGSAALGRILNGCALSPAWALTIRRRAAALRSTVASSSATTRLAARR